MMSRLLGKRACVDGYPLWFAVALSSLLGSGCYSTNSYLLRINAQEPSKSELCEIESGSKRTCEPLSGQTLDSPGVLALEISNSTAEKDYSLEVAETRLSAPSAPTPDQVVREVAGRLTGLSKDFVGKLDDRKHDASVEEAKNLLVSVSKAVAPRQPGAAVALQGIADRLSRKSVPTPRAQTELKAIWTPWIDPATLGWKTKLVQGDTRIPAPLAVKYSNVDMVFIAEQVKDPKTQKPRPEKLTGSNLASFTIAFCKPESFGNDPFTGQPWATEPAPWSNPQELLKKLALEPQQIEDLVKSGNSKLSERIGALLDEWDKAAQQNPPGAPSDAAKALKYLLFVSRIAADLDRCEHNLAFVSGLPGASTKEVADTLRSVQETRQRLEATVTAERVFEDMIAPFAVSAAVRAITQRSPGGTLTFGTYTLHPGHLALTATTGGDEKPEVISKQEFVVRDVGAVAVSIGPFVSVCNDCIHAVTERFDVGTDAQGNPTVTRSLQDETKSASIGAAAVLHYTLFGDTKNQFGFALGYPLRDQTGTALGVLAGLSWRNTLGLQAAVGAHVFETQKLNSGRKSGEASTTSLDDATQSVPTGAVFFFIGATSDLLVKP